MLRHYHHQDDRWQFRISTGQRLRRRDDSCCLQLTSVTVELQVSLHPPRQPKQGKWFSWHLYNYQGCDLQYQENLRRPSRRTHDCDEKKNGCPTSYKVVSPHSPPTLWLCRYWVEGSWCNNLIRLFSYLTRMRRLTKPHHVPLQLSQKKCRNMQSFVTSSTSNCQNRNSHEPYSKSRSKKGWAQQLSETRRYH